MFYLEYSIRYYLIVVILLAVCCVYVYIAPPGGLLMYDKFINDPAYMLYEVRYYRV